jgi:hypothetical protein
MSENRFEMTIQLDFSVPFFERNTSITDQELADTVYRAVEEERNNLVCAAKLAAIRILNGEPIDG